jgi:hypothetical protein
MIKKIIKKIKNWIKAKKNERELAKIRKKSFGNRNTDIYQSW